MKRLCYLIDERFIMADVQALLARLNSQIVSSGMCAQQSLVRLSAPFCIVPLLLTYIHRTYRPKAQCS